MAIETEREDVLNSCLHRFDIVDYAIGRANSVLKTGCWYVDVGDLTGILHVLHAVSTCQLYVAWQNRTDTSLITYCILSTSDTRSVGDRVIDVSPTKIFIGDSVIDVTVADVYSVWTTICNCSQTCITSSNSQVQVKSASFKSKTSPLASSPSQVH